MVPRTTAGVLNGLSHKLLRSGPVSWLNGNSDHTKGNSRDVIRHNIQHEFRSRPRPRSAVREMSPYLDPYCSADEYAPKDP
jgi:hypothetical protein